MLLTFFAEIVFCDQFVIVDRADGDRLTGRWLNSTDQHFEIEYNGQVLRLPLVGNTLTFTNDLENVPDKTATRHYRRALDLLDLEFPELARRQFESALEEFPKYTDAHYQLGLLYQNNGDTENALLRFRSVLLIDSEKYDLVPLLKEIGDNASEIEDFTNAVNAYQLIISYYPENERVGKLSYKTGFMLVENLKDTVAGLELLQNAVSQYHSYSEHEKAVYLVGVLQSESGKFDTALNTFTQFIRLYPESDLVDDALLKQAVIFLQIGDKTNAERAANLVERKTEDPTIVKNAKDIISATAWNIFTKDLPDINIQTIVVDGTSLWIGTPKGIAQIETGGKGRWEVIEGVAWTINSHKQTVPDVRSIAVNENGIWVGTRNQGVIHYNKKTDEVQQYTLRNPDGLPITWIRDIKIDNEEIWYATDSGVIREILSTGERFPYHGNNPVPNNIHSITLTPDAVWVGTTGNDIAIFNRELEFWKQLNFLDISQDTQIVEFDSVGDKLIFTWFNEVNNSNGFLYANWDGSEGNSTSILDETEDNIKLENIFVTGIVDNRLVGQENGEPNPKSIILWITDDIHVSIYYPLLDKFDGAIPYPKIVMEDLSINCIAVDKDRAWIGTTKGILSIEKQTVSNTAE